MMMTIEEISIYNLIQGENVLIIGSGPSGIDIGRKIVPVARKVTMSQHFAGDIMVLKKCFHVKGDVCSLTENGAVFADGSYEDFSTILYATGKFINI